MSIPLSHFGVAMTRDTLDLIQCPRAIDQERSLLMPEAVNSQMRQSCLLPRPRPNPHDRRIGLSRFSVDKQVIKRALGI